MRWRLFDFGKVKAEIAQARGAYAEELVAYHQTALKATEDIENAMFYRRNSPISDSDAGTCRPE